MGEQTMENGTNRTEAPETKRIDATFEDGDTQATRNGGR
jgi:hypothetical protein